MKFLYLLVIFGLAASAETEFSHESAYAGPPKPRPIKGRSA